jgi:hypothetical protein
MKTASRVLGLAGKVLLLANTLLLVSIFLGICGRPRA